MALLWVGFVLFSNAREESQLPAPNTSRVVMLFLGTFVDGLAVAVIVASLIVPAIAGQMGNFFFNPGGEIEKDPHADAIAKLARGDPEGAIKEYEAILDKDPGRYPRP